jgi:hypothetical protein
VKSVKEIKRWKTLKKNKDNCDINTVIELAWCDKTSFKIWRERVYSRKAKHEKLSNYNFIEKND